jgi:hypothetical protein
MLSKITLQASPGIRPKEATLAGRRLPCAGFSLLLLGIGLHHTAVKQQIASQQVFGMT